MAARLLLPPLAFLCLAGCGSGWYALRASEAESELRQAEQAGAVQHAPYDYYFSLEHLRKARAEAADADYGDAVALAETARDSARRAFERARVPATAPSSKPAPPMGGVEPGNASGTLAEIARLQQVADSAEQAGALRCAPRELAVARSQLEFAALESAQGSRVRAERHLKSAEQHTQAARLLSETTSCQQ
jgi:hypothetical protein